MKTAFNLLIFTCAFFCLGSETKAATKPVGKIFYSYDDAVAGCAYDPANPEAKIQVHVYSEDGLDPVIGLAGYGCPWSSDLEFQGHGFQIQYRRPKATPTDVNVALISSAGGDPTWLSTNESVHKVILFERDQKTFLYETEKYKIGISRKYGAAVSEFYNKRIDRTMNLVTSNPGAMVQAALFGAESKPSFLKPNCVGNKDNRYNPTQSGSACPDSKGAMLGAVIYDCKSSSKDTLCTKNNANKPVPNDANPDWIQYQVRFRNFYNPAGTTRYQPYEDVYGIVKYVFYSAYVQVEHQIWKTNKNTYGDSFQQLPVAFLNQVNKLTTWQNTLARGKNEVKDIASSVRQAVGVSSPQWVLGEVVQGIGPVPVSSPGNFVTLGFYSAVVNSKGSSCPSRAFQLDLLGGAGSLDNQWLSVQHSSVAQSIFVSVQPEMLSYYQARAIMSPYRPNEVLGNGKSISELLNMSEQQGGISPLWNCK